MRQKLTPSSKTNASNIFRVFAKLVLMNFLAIFCAPLVWGQIPTPFTCTNLAYQISGSNTENSSLYSYNVSTGTRTLIGELGSRVNAIGYNTLDNFIWGINVLTNQAVKIGSNASLTAYTIPNLPAPDVTAYYNVGEVFGDGYLFIYSRLSTRYFVIDINPSRPGTYLKLVDPTAGFAEDIAPYGNTFLGASDLNISDLTYNSSNGLFYGIIDPQSATNRYRMFTINPVTRQISISGSTIAGGNIQIDELTAFGSAFIDPTNNAFYVFSNTLGKFYKINTTTLAATLISTAATGGANNNDGASCPTAFLTASISGIVFHDPNGGNVNNSTGATNAVPAGLFANLVNEAGDVVASVPVNSAGGYGFDGTAPGTYTVVLSTTNGTIGNPAPSPSLPAGWVNTGEFNGAPNTGTSLPIDGVSQAFTITSGSSISDINFGIQQPPVADIKAYTLSSTPSVNDIINLSAGGNNNSGNTPGNLTGNDPDGSVLNSTTAPYGVTINTLPNNGTLIYDGTPITTTGFYIPNYDPAKLQLQFTGSGYSGTLFTYSVHDAAGSVSPAVNYNVSWEGPLPVTLVSFKVETENTAVSLKWLTATEENSKGFEIQRSGDVKNWENLGFVDVKSFNGSSRSELSYSFTDAIPLKGINYYRLKMVDLDVSFAYSRVVSVDIESEMPYAWPNPTAGTIKLSKSNLSEVKKVELVNTNGKVVYKAQQIPAEGINVKGLVGNGTYVLRVNYTDGSQSSHKIVIVN